MALNAANQKLYSAVELVGSAQKTAFTIAAFGSSVLVVNAPAGLYDFKVCLVLTTLEGSSHTVTVNAIYTDDLQSETLPVMNAQTTAATGTFSASAIIENTAAANISWSIATTDTGTAIGNFYIAVLRIF